MSLAWREHQRDGVAQGIDECVNFGGHLLRDRPSLAGRFFSRAGAAPTSAHDGGIDHHVFVIVVVLTA